MFHFVIQYFERHCQVKVLNFGIEEMMFQNLHKLEICQLLISKYVLGDKMVF